MLGTLHGQLKQQHTKLVKLGFGKFDKEEKRHWVLNLT